MTLPPLDFRRDVALARRWPLVVQARELSLDALTGQAGTLTRAATKAVTDSSGVSRTVNYHQPAWTAVSGVAALDLGSSDSLAYDCDLLPVACCGLVDFFHNSPGANGTVIDITNSTPATPYLRVYWTGTQYRIEHHNGSAAVTATMTGTAPSASQRVRLRWWLYSTGAVQIWQSKDGAAETTPGASGTNALAAAWAATTKYFVNSAGTAAGTYGAMKLAGLVVGLGNQSQAAMLAALAG